MTLSPTSKPPLKINADSREFWDYTLQDCLMLRTCNSCGLLMYYPRVLCTSCMSTDLGWTKSSGKGTVYAFSIVHRAPNEAFKSDVPYIIAIIELDEGPRMLSNIIDCPPDQSFINMPVVVSFDKSYDGFKLPKFRPCKGAQ